MEPTTAVDVFRASQDISTALRLLGVMITGSTLIGGTAVVWAFKKFVNHIIERDERWATLVEINTAVTRELKGTIVSCPGGGKFEYIQKKLDGIHKTAEENKLDRAAIIKAAP